MSNLQLIEVTTEEAQKALDAFLANQEGVNVISYHSLLVDPLPHELNPAFQARLEESAASANRGESISLEQLKVEIAEWKNL